MLPPVAAPVTVNVVEMEPTAGTLIAPDVTLALIIPVKADPEAPNLKVPLTSNFVLGEVVPIPTLPPD